MDNYFEGKSDKNLIDMMFTAVPAKRETIFAELQKRQQENNNKQIHSLISEVKNLKNIVDINAKISIQNNKSNNRLSIIAIVIAVIGIITQVAFSIHNEVKCNTIRSSSSNPRQINSNCYRILDFGLFGRKILQIPDYYTQ